jgi:hypothetical protein
VHVRYDVSLPNENPAVHLSFLQHSSDWAEGCRWRRASFNFKVKVCYWAKVASVAPRAGRGLPCAARQTSSLAGNGQIAWMQSLPKGTAEVVNEICLGNAKKGTVTVEIREIVVRGWGTLSNSLPYDRDTDRRTAISCTFEILLGSSPTFNPIVSWTRDSISWDPNSIRQTAPNYVPALLCGNGNETIRRYQTVRIVQAQQSPALHRRSLRPPRFQSPGILVIG